MNRNLLIFAVILIIVVALAFISFSNVRVGIGKKTADIHGQIISLEIADSLEEQRKGLSQRHSLAKDQGMLFVFSKAENHSFWMKDMRFPIDIIFLKDDKVVTIYDTVQPRIGEEKAANLALYTPTEPVNRVLEINAGLAKKYNLKEGDTIKIDL